MFVTNRVLQDAAETGGYAVGAFNINNLEIVLAIARAATEERAPVIFAVSPSAMKYAGSRQIASIAAIAAEDFGLTASLHLDHGSELEHVRKALDVGFSSVMIDASKEPFEENIRVTREAVSMAREAGASIEAELGKLVGVEDDISVSEREASMTDPDQAVVFVRETGIDALAVAIGNAHGWYKGEPNLDFGRLEAIREATADSVRLVLHGASGIGGSDIRKAVEMGITKINIDTEIRDAFRRGTEGFMKANQDVIDPRKFLAPAMDEMAQVVAGKIVLFGSADKAV